jgi:hypothetical protein
MTKISFQLKFDTQVDLKKKNTDIAKFLDKHFIKKISDNLVHFVSFDERWAKNSVENKSLKKKEFDSYKFSEFKETAKNTTQEIKDSIVYEVVGTNGSIQDINISFSINYNIDESSKYCTSIEHYLQHHIIDQLISQTERLKEMAEKLNTKETPRVVKMDEHLLELLNQMKETLKIEQPKKVLKM